MNINRPEGNLEPKVPKETPKEIKKPKKTLVEEGVDSTKLDKPKKVISYKKAHVQRDKGIGVNASVKEVKKDKTIKRSERKVSTKNLDKPPKKEKVKEDPQITERNKVITKLFVHLSTKYPNEDFLRSNLEKGLGKFNKTSHTFSIGTDVVIVSKVGPGESVIGIADIEAKYLGRGGFGKVYSVDLLDDKGEVALKLSRKKRSGNKAVTLPTDRGIRAREAIKYEVQVMNYIRDKVPNAVGLNLEMYGKVKYKHQLGYFLKKFDLDALKFYSKYAIPPEVCYQLMKHTLIGMTTMHKLNLVHRDIKLENILVRKTEEKMEGTEYPDFEFVLSDFGNTVSLRNLFVESDPYPSFNKIFGSGTECYISKKFTVEVEDLLGKLKKTSPGSSDYKTIARKIVDILINNDKLALNLSFYQLWVRKEPPFKSFRVREYLEFNLGATQEQNKQMIENMRRELLSVTMQLSQEMYNKSDQIANAIIDQIYMGL